ncbi:MAG: type II secretion system protein [Thiovulaceae bacterium]|nr:type II secretion system protein [Sulfurimonadaceae bacterium]
MKRAGFTMIELIFVIVILGILSAVALPKFIGVSEQAHVGKLKAYVGTLNRTVAPALWSESISGDLNGSIASAGALTAGYQAKLDSQITGPSELDANGTLNSTNCGLTYPSEAVGAVDSVNTTLKAGTNAFAKATTIGSKQYYIGCADGNATSSPLFFLEDNNGTILTK